ncbi:hypothetical protein N185_16385 [Sinorhizobium sp. GW3]|nr:hypothetical protein N185_16385 [Sinorhizobium sp. GW3]
MEIKFPAYGEFATVYQNSVNPQALAPAAWRPNLPQAERESSWKQWRSETLAIINSTLWPQWDENSHDWLNGDYDKMLALTLADFEQFARLHAAGVFDAAPKTPVSAASIPTHRQYFVDEDTGKLGERYYFYDHSLPSAQLEKLPTDLRAGLKDKAGSVSIQFKQFVQRPRAYQVAKLLGRPHNFELAATSMTSSMTSGHCFQGCLAAACIYEAWIARGFNPTDQQIEALQQFGVDIGDRRTFAGVHYPSDNMSSWILSLRLGREVFSDQRIWTFLVDAILKRSAIYSLITTSGAAVYSDALAEIETLVKQMSGNS